jgi:hypothetical protein
MKKKAICKNCVLYRRDKGICGVVVLYEGERINIPVEPNDPCFYKDKFKALDGNMEIDEFQPEIEQLRWWVEDPKTGKQIDGKGIVKFQYPSNFFGEDDLEKIEKELQEEVSKEELKEKNKQNLEISKIFKKDEQT